MILVNSGGPCAYIAARPGATAEYHSNLILILLLLLLLLMVHRAIETQQQ
jgi:hypothetical protein